MWFVDLYPLSIIYAVWIATIFHLRDEDFLTWEILFNWLTDWLRFWLGQSTVAEVPDNNDETVRQGTAISSSWKEVPIQ